ncbi:hypothetical protein D918_08044 [Trichuris suis]|nr:hypothetical protein D918_08044 [Trichuris suis]
MNDGALQVDPKALAAPRFDCLISFAIGQRSIGGVVDADGKSPVEALLKFVSRTNITAAMGSLEKLLSESYKFIRLSDDINDMKNYINDMRLCFVALTISGYLAVIFYVIMLLCNRRNGRRNRRLRNPSSTAAAYDEEALGWGEKPMPLNPASSRMPPTQGDRDSYQYRAAGRRHMQPFGRQRYNVAAALSDLSERQLVAEGGTVKVNGPMESTPLAAHEPGSTDVVPAAQ